jgi:hypothetical protein
MKFIKKTIRRGTSSGIGMLLAAVLTLNTGIVHAQTSIGSTFQNAVSSTKATANKNSLLRNQLITDQSSDVQDKEKTLADELGQNLLSLENIQTRIAAKTAESAASGIDTTAVNTWLATSSDDIVNAQNEVSAFTAYVIATSSDSESQAQINHARKLADSAINAVNSTHEDLQSALDALTAIL